MKFVKAYPRNPGDGKPIEREKILNEIKFNKFKFNNRPVPDKSQILIITCFSEFGCESLALMYCIPDIIKKNPGAYVICVGWYGREYLYRHLCDEYWEIQEDFQWLREGATAFNQTSKNIHRLEESLNDYGKVFKGESMGYLCLGNTCKICDNFFDDEDRNCVCPKCKSNDIERCLLADIPFHRNHSVKIPKPAADILEKAKSYLKPNSVGIFARGRITYGRNLSPEFYIKLIKNLEDKGYNPIWLGEKQSVLPCPVDHIIDFSRLPEARNLELTLAIISQLKFTVQFWTASTRLASMMDIPWILVESNDQIYGNGQEGKRIALTTDFDKKKIVICNYHSFKDNEEMAFNLLDQAINEINQNNWDDIIGLVENPEFVKLTVKNYWE